MNNDIAKGRWDKLSGDLKQEWGKLTDDDVKQIEGKFEKFAGVMREKYGMSKDEAEKAFNRFTN